MWEIFKMETKKYRTVCRNSSKFKYENRTSNRERIMVFNATFNNISVASWLSVLLMEETGIPGQNHRPVASHWQTLTLYWAHLSMSGIRAHNFRGNMHWLHRQLWIQQSYVKHMEIKKIVLIPYMIQYQIFTCTRNIGNIIRISIIFYLLWDI